MSDDALSGRAKKVVQQMTDAVGEHLSAGESIELAVRVNLKGTVTATAAGALGGATGAVAAANALSPGVEEAAAAGFPTDTQQALGLTSSALVVASRSGFSGKPKTYRCSVPLSAIASVVHEPGRLGDQLTLTMADGSSTTFECVKVDPGAEFAEAVTRRLGSGRAPDATS